MIVFLNSGLSDITNKVKKTNDMIKHIIQKTPIPFSPFLIEMIANNNGTNRKSMNPITDPAPCTFEAVVTMSFDSLTLKKPVNIHAPIAKTAINTATVMVIPPEIL